jgi:hypothetical protein
VKSLHSVDLVNTTKIESWLEFVYEITQVELITRKLNYHSMSGLKFKNIHKEVLSIY